MKRFTMLVHALAACALLMPLHAIAQAWPTRPVHIIVPYPAGGTSDILARTLGQKPPRELVGRINADFTRVLNTPEIREKLGAQGAEVRVNTPETFAVFLREETARWAKVVSANGVKPE